MFRVVLADGSIQELPGVARAEVLENCLICYNERGAIESQYGPREVLAYGDDGSILAMSDATTLDGLAADREQARKTT